MTGYTKGPWRYVRENGSPTTGKHMIAGARPGYLAEVRDCGSGDVSANARLIAAAPDLLAVAECEEALSKLCREGWPIIEQHGWNPSSREGPTAYVARMRRAAIAKATGGAHE